MKIYLKVKIIQRLIVVLLYFCSLSFLYSRFIAPIYFYLGYGLIFSSVKLLLSLLTIVLFASLSSKNKLLSVYYELVIAFIIIPSMVLFTCSGAGYDFYCITIMGCFVIIFISKYIRVKSVKFVKFSENLILSVLILTTVIYFIGILAQGGGKFFNINLMKVYEFRKLASNNLHPIYNYFTPIMTGAIMPFILVLGASRKSKFCILYGLFCGIMLFAFTAHKTPLFSCFVILFVYFIYSFEKKLYIHFFCFVMVVCSFVSFFLEELGIKGVGIIGSLFGRRLLLTPIKLNFQYINFFSENAKYYWAYSKFSFGLVDSPYTLSPPYLIGHELYGLENLSANVGFIGSGYSNSGVAGVFLYSVIIGLILSFFKSVSKKVGEKEVVALTVIMVLTILRSTDLTSSILTHGMGVLILLFVLFPKKEIC